MINLNNLVEIGFTLPKATNISAFLSNVGYIGDFGENDLVGELESRRLVISSLASLDAIFKKGTKYYEDLSSILGQKNNAKPNQGGINEIHIYQKQEESFAEALSDLMKEDADFGQVVISSNEKADILAIAGVCQGANRLFIAQTADSAVLNNTEENLAIELKNAGYSNTKLIYHDVAEGIDGALASVMASDFLGSNGDLYSAFAGINSADYTDTAMSNLDANNVSYYSTVNAINGGGVKQYGNTILVGNKQANGEITKRRYIRFTLDLLLKAKVIDFLVKKLTYQESSNNILEGYLKSVLIEAQGNDLVVADSEETNGFYIKCMPIAEIRKHYKQDYDNQVYRANGWYIDALTGTKVVIDLAVNPSDAEKNAIEL